MRAIGPAGRSRRPDRRVSQCRAQAEWWRYRRLVLVLKAVELPVDAAVREELLVRAVLAELAFVHDKDGVGALHGGEAVRDDDRGAAGDHAVKRGADADLGVGVD